MQTVWVLWENTLGGIRSPTWRTSSQSKPARFGWVNYNWQVAVILFVKKPCILSISVTTLLWESTQIMSFLFQYLSTANKTHSYFECLFIFCKFKAIDTESTTQMGVGVEHRGIMGTSWPPSRGTWQLMWPSPLSGLSLCLSVPSVLSVWFSVSQDWSDLRPDIRGKIRKDPLVNYNRKQEKEKRMRQRTKTESETWERKHHDVVMLTIFTWFNKETQNGKESSSGSQATHSPEKQQWDLYLNQVGRNI